MYTRASLLLVVIVSVALPGLGAQPTSQGRTETQLRQDAEAFLDLLRAGRYEAAVPLVSLDSATRAAMDIPSGADPEVVRSRAGAWLRRTYGPVRPGTIWSVQIDPGDSTLARVLYRHGDLDAFYMRFVEGRWRYSLDWRPRVPYEHARDSSHRWRDAPHRRRDGLPRGPAAS